MLGAGKRRAVQGSVIGLEIGRRTGGISDRWAVEGSILGRCYIAPLGLGRAFGSTGRRRIGPRSVVASTSFAAGIGDAVGIEVRQALHRSAGVTAGLRIDGS